jgi:putative membrane protein
MPRRLIEPAQEAPVDHRISPQRSLLACVMAAAGIFTACDRRTDPVASSSAAPAARPGTGAASTAPATRPGMAAPASAGATTAAPTPPPVGKPVSAKDVEFVATAASGSALEVEASKLAMERTKNASVRNFAQKMVDDHSKASAELRALPTASSVGNLSAMIPKHNEQLKKLRELQGAATFDREYATKIGVSVHEETIDLFQKAADAAADSQIKAFAQKKLPELREHLKMAQAMAREVGGAAKPAAKPAGG